MLKFCRAVLKLSGEALQGSRGEIVSADLVSFLVEEIREVLALGGEIALVVGGGNILRGMNAEKEGVNRVKADQAGMLATLINSILLQEAFERAGIPSRVLSSFEVKGIADAFNQDQAIHYLSKGEVLLLACGTGNPFFSTDTAGVLRALELSADILIKATKVDGVYDRDPVKDPMAKKFDRMTFEIVLSQGLRVMDLTAFSLAKENNLPIVVLKFPEKSAIRKALLGEPVGTFIGNSD